MLLGLRPAALAGQGIVLTGRVVRVSGRDSTPVPRVWAVLHQVSLASGAPVDSALTDARGRYRVRAAARDTAAVYLVSVVYQGIAYFTTPVHLRRAVAADTLEWLAVYDTSSTAPAIELAERHLVVRKPGADGARPVLELLVLRNRGTRTRVAPDTARPVWQGSLPAEAVQFEAGQSEVSPEAVYRRGDSIAVAAAIPPGEKQVVVSYLLPRSVRRLALAVDQPTARLDVFLEEHGLVPEAPGWERLDDQVIEGTRFARFARTQVAAGARIAVPFPRAGSRLEDWWWVVVAAAAAALGAGLLAAWRRREAGAPTPAAEDPEVVAAQIAALDAAFERQRAAGPDDRARYQAQRAALKARLEELLARRRG